MEARAVTLGAAAFDRGQPRAACPYADETQARYWRLGWNVRRRARARWDRYAEWVEETVARAAPYIDRDSPIGKVPPSKLLALRFYVIGSTKPDEAWAWFCGAMNGHRARYRARAPHGEITS